MKIWIIEFQTKEGTTTFEKTGDDIDRIITELKKDFPKYKAYSYQRKN